MNTPNRPHEELDADERELARVVRALPGNEPPPALDLRILKAAQDAVAVAPTKRSHRALWAANSAGSLWGLGTAAAAVLAVGISWQLFMRAPSSNLPASGPAIIAKDNAQDRDSTPVDFVSAAPKADQGVAANQMAPAPASEPMSAGQRAASAAQPMRQEQESKPVVAGAPQPFLDEHVAEANEARSRDQAPVATTEQAADDLRSDSAAAKSAIAENAPAESAADAAAAPAAAMASAPAPAAPPPMDAERRELTAAQKPELAKTTADTGMLAGTAAPAAEAQMQSKQAGKESPEAAKQRVRLDVRLYPESWILKIRSRLKQGDVAGARASLKLFVEKYPQETVPDNLKPLLGE